MQGLDGEGEGLSQFCRASAPIGKTDGEEVLGRVMSSANEKYGVLWEPLLGDREPDSSGGEWKKVGTSSVRKSYPQFSMYPSQNVHTSTQMCNICNFISISLMG